MHFVLKQEYYDAILKGTKTIEFRAAKPHWTSRISGASWACFSVGVFTRDIADSFWVNTASVHAIKLTK